MEIWNHFTFKDSDHPKLASYIKSNNIPYEGEGEILQAVDISENDPHWEAIHYLLQIEKDKPKEDAVTLLRRFGRRTVANPYELFPVGGC